MPWVCGFPAQVEVHGVDVQLTRETRPSAEAQLASRSADSALQPVGSPATSDSDGAV